MAKWAEGKLLEVDISDKARAVVKYGFMSLLLLAVLCGGGAWLYRSHMRTLAIAEAQVAGDVVVARARAAGTVAELLAEDGAAVRQGEALARIHVKVSDEQIRQLEEQLAFARRNLDALRAGTTTVRPAAGGGAEAEKARANAERMRQLYELGAVSAKERDEAEAAYRAALADGVSYQEVTRPASPQAIQRAETQARQAEAALAAARQASAAAELPAPVNGIAYLADGIEPGAEVRPGQAVFRIGNAERLWLEAYAPPDAREHLHAGQAASYALDGHALTGSVLDVIDPPGAPDTENAGGTDGGRPDDPRAGKLTVLISIPSTEGLRIRPAMKTSVRIALD